MAPGLPSEYPPAPMLTDPDPARAHADLDLLQWPAMVVTIAAAWLVAGQSKLKRRIGFWVFLVSNVLWIAWSWQARAWALMALQICLAILNVRGARKNQADG